MGRGGECLEGAAAAAAGTAAEATAQTPGKVDRTTAEAAFECLEAPEAAVKRSALGGGESSGRANCDEWRLRQEERLALSGEGGGGRAPCGEWRWRRRSSALQ
eukprot:365087-Chlamydomonas_euryale.AAC.15